VIPGYRGAVLEFDYGRLHGRELAVLFSMRLILDDEHLNGLPVRLTRVGASSAAPIELHPTGFGGRNRPRSALAAM
jgi:hypothetical protein